MESINAVLSNRDFSEPEEITRLKSYISQKYGADSIIQVNPKGLVIVVNSSALANTIRLNLPAMQRELNIKQKLFIRIS